MLLQKSPPHAPLCCGVLWVVFARAIALYHLSSHHLRSLILSALQVLPALVPKINTANNLAHPPIDVFSAMGGSSGLECGYGSKKATPFLCGHKCVATDKDPACALQVRYPLLFSARVEQQLASRNRTALSRPGTHLPLARAQCDGQSCDPCHPNVNGYTVLAATVMKALGL